MVDLQDIPTLQDITGEMNPAQAKRYSRKRINAICRATKTTLDIAKARFKAEFDRSIWFSPQIAIRRYVHLNRPLKEKQEAKDITNKRLPKSTGPFKVLKS